MKIPSHRDEVLEYKRIPETQASPLVVKCGQQKRRERRAKARK